MENLTLDVLIKLEASKHDVTTSDQLNLVSKKIYVCYEGSECEAQTIKIK